jgi:hypothetical protein
MSGRSCQIRKGSMSFLRGFSCSPDSSLDDMMTHLKRGLEL